MKRNLIILGLGLVILIACSTPREWIYVQEHNITHAKSYRDNMNAIAHASLDGYSKTGKQYYKEKYEDFLRKAAERGGGKITPGFAKVMNEWLMKKYSEIDQNVGDVKGLITDADIDYLRFVEGTELILKKMKERGLSPEQWQMIAGAVEEASKDIMEGRQASKMADIQNKISKLNSDLNSAKEGGEETAELSKMLAEELEKERNRKRLLEEFVERERVKEDRKDGEDTDKLRKAIEEALKKREGTGGGSGSNE